MSKRKKPTPPPAKVPRCESPAFPRPATSRDLGASGMTLRDYFAAFAMQALLANPNAIDEPLEVAISAYIHSDAMLEARKQ